MPIVYFNSCYLSMIEGQPSALFEAEILQKSSPLKTIYKAKGLWNKDNILFLTNLVLSLNFHIKVKIIIVGLYG